MEYVVVVEKKKKGYRAVAPALPDCAAEGKTRADVLEKMQQAITDRLSKVEITTVEVEAQPSPDPWAPFIGMWKADPTWDEFQTEIANYRKRIDQEPPNA